jgi:hypothetical protein
MNTLLAQVHQWLVVVTEGNAVVKTIAFLMVWALFWLPLAIPLAKFVQWQPSFPLTTKQKIILVASLYLIAPFIIYGWGKVEGNSLADYGLSNNLRFWLSFVLGVVGAMVHIAIVYGLEYLWGWLQWHPENIAQLKSAIAPIFLLAIWIGATEELIFRGFLLNLLSQDYSIPVAGAISSLIFALLHLLWEQRETMPQLPGLGLMGMVLVVAFLGNDHNLGLAIGLHTGWIWVLSSLDSAKLISYTAKVSPWITGMGEKPLAGVVGIVGLLVTGGVIWLVGIGF